MDDTRKIRFPTGEWEMAYVSNWCVVEGPSRENIVGMVSGYKAPVCEVDEDAGEPMAMWVAQFIAAAPAMFHALLMASKELDPDSPARAAVDRAVLSAATDEGLPAQFQKMQ